MKTTIMRSMLMLTATLGAFALVPTSSATSDPAAGAYSIASITVDPTHARVERGSSQDAVLKMMGAPFVKLAPDVWVYEDGHEADSTLVSDPDYRTLIVMFAKNKVSDLKLVNRAAADKIAENIRLKHTDFFALLTARYVRH